MNNLNNAASLAFLRDESDTIKRSMLSEAEARAIEYYKFDATSMDQPHVRNLFIAIGNAMKDIGKEGSQDPVMAEFYEGMKLGKKIPYLGKHAVNNSGLLAITNATFWIPPERNNINSNARLSQVSLKITKETYRSPLLSLVVNSHKTGLESKEVDAEGSDLATLYLIKDFMADINPKWYKIEN